MSAWSLRVLLVYCFSCALTVSAAEQPTLTWCLQHLPPRQFYPEQGEPYGPMVDFMRKLSNNAGFRLKFTPPTPNTRCLKLMQQGDVDLMVGLLKTPERSEFMHMWPFDNARPAALFTLKSAALFTSSNDLRGRKIILVNAFTYPEPIRAELSELQVQVMPVPTIEDALALLLYRQADVVVAPYHMTLHAIAQNPRFKPIVVQQQQLQSANVAQNYLALSRKSKYAAQALQLEGALQQLLLETPPDFYQQSSAPATSTEH